MYCHDNDSLEGLDITGCVSLRGLSDTAESFEETVMFDATNCPNLKEITAYGLDENMFVAGRNYDETAMFLTSEEATQPSGWCLDHGLDEDWKDVVLF